MTEDLLTAVRATLRARVAELATMDPVDAAVAEEPLSEAVVEVAGLDTARLPAALRVVLVEDLAARLGLLPWPGALPSAARALPGLLPGDRFAALLDEARLPGGLTPRLAEAARWVSDDVDRLRAVHASEWCDGALDVMAPGGADLVVRVARLLVGAALVRRAAAEGDPLSETTARRYAWRWLRDPAPEAATPRHRARTAELLRVV